MERCNINCEIIQALVNSSDIPTFFLEKDGTIINCNLTSLPYLNISSIKDAENKKLSNFLDPNFYEEIRKVMLETIFRGKFIKYSYHCLKKDKFYDILCTPIRKENKPPNNTVDFLFLHIMDKTEMQKIMNDLETAKNKAEESDILKSTFLSNISHELKTPMNSIIGFSDLLLDSNFNQNKNRFIKAINTNAKHLEELLNNIIDYAKIESGSLDLLYENFNILELFDDLNDMFVDINYQKNLNSVKIIFDKNKNDKIVSDYFRLKQILHNLISNAIKFTDSGHIKIGYTLLNNNITFYVEDTGIGIAKNKKNIIFDRFVQLDSSSTKKYKGTGLGLSIVKNLVENMGGKIWVDSKLQSGSTFFFNIPYEKIETNCRMKPLKNTNNEKMFDNKTIMIIDNVTDNFSLLSLILKSKNIKVFCVDENDAVDKYKKENKFIDAIFLDFDSSNIDINKLIDKLKHINNNITIISSSNDDNFKIKNIDYHIQKPFTRDKIFNILNQIFK